MLKAHFVGTYKGKRVHRFPVEVKLNKGFGGTVDDWLNPGREVHIVLSDSAAKAADYIRELYATRAETEITVYGPKGGKAAYRFIGWESSIWGAMASRPKESQIRLHYPDGSPLFDAEGRAV